MFEYSGPPLAADGERSTANPIYLWAGIPQPGTQNIILCPLLPTQTPPASLLASRSYPGSHEMTRSGVCSHSLPVPLELHGESFGRFPITQRDTIMAHLGAAHSKLDHNMRSGAPHASPSGLGMHGVASSTTPLQFHLSSKVCACVLPSVWYDRSMFEFWRLTWFHV